MARKELLEVIGRDGRIKRLASRDEVHSKGLLHKTVHVLLFNSRGKLFLQKRGARVELWPGYWESSSSGHVDPGESFGESARRELKEELGLEGKLKWLFKLNMFNRLGRIREYETTHVFKIVSDAKPQLQKGEVDGGKWVSLEELNAMMRRGEKVTPSMRKTFARGKKLKLFKA